MVPIGKSDIVKIPWSMLLECFNQMNDSGYYDGVFFNKRYPRQALDHPCHVHVVGRIFVVAGIAHTDGKKYHLRESRE